MRKTQAAPNVVPARGISRPYNTSRGMLLAHIRDLVFSALRRLAPAKLAGADRGALISTITSDGHMPAGIYSIDGKRQNEFQKGLNILILEDGTAQKVFVK